jgi:hypothetical protein
MEGQAMTRKQQDINSNIPTMNQERLYAYLLWCLEKLKNLLIVGRPGIGKTDIVKQACRALKYRLIVAHPVVHNPTHYSGLGWVFQLEDGTPQAEFVPYGFLRDLITTTDERLVMFFDDVGQATSATQAAMMQLFLERALNGKKISDMVSFLAATNRREDKAAVGGILEPLKSRFDGGIQHLMAELDPHCKWMMAHRMPIWLIAYERFRPEVVTDWEPSADLVNSICPRTLAFVGEAVNDGLPEDMWQSAFSGMVGVGRTAEMLTFYRYSKNIPNPDAIIMNPDKAEIPMQPEIQYALTTALANKSSEKNFDAVIRYFDRWFEGGNFKDGVPRSEFVLAYFKDAIVRHPALKDTQAYVQWFVKHSDVYI